MSAKRKKMTKPPCEFCGSAKAKWTTGHPDWLTAHGKGRTENIRLCDGCREKQPGG